MIGEYENAISDEVVDALKDYMDSKENFQLQGQIGANGTIDRAIKDSLDFNILGEFGGDEDYIHKTILPMLSEQLDQSLIKYLKDYPTSQDMIDVLDKDDEEILEEFYKTYSHWPLSIVMKKYNKGKQGYHGFHEDKGNTEPTVYRDFVLMFYLADVDKGGETEFYHQGVKVKPKKGKVVIFPSGWTHLHKGHIPESNDKYICNFWILKGSMELKPTIAGKWNTPSDLPENQ